VLPGLPDLFTGMTCCGQGVGGTEIHCNEIPHSRRLIGLRNDPLMPCTEKPAPGRGSDRKAFTRCHGNYTDRAAQSGLRHHESAGCWETGLGCVWGRNVFVTVIPIVSVAFRRTRRVLEIPSVTEVAWNTGF
jgi:hypothetical protein